MMIVVLSIWLYSNNIYIKNVIERKRKIDEFNINSPYTSDDFKKKNFIKQRISYKTMATSTARSYTYKLPWIYASSPSTSTNKLSNIIYLLSFFFWYLWNMIICLISFFLLLSHCWRRSFACSIVIQAGYFQNLNGLVQYIKWPSMCK
jgi:hypothetical protein